MAKKVITYSRYSLCDTWIRYLEYTDQDERMGFTQFMLDLGRGITLGLPDQGIPGEKIPQSIRRQLKPETLKQYLIQHQGWDEQQCCILLDGIKHYAQTQMYAIDRLSRYALKDKEGYPIWQNKKRRHYLFVKENILYFQAEGDGPSIYFASNSADEIPQSIETNSKYTYLFSLNAQGCRFEYFTISGNKDFIETLAQYIQQQNNTLLTQEKFISIQKRSQHLQEYKNLQHVKEKLLSICDQYLKNLRKIIEHAWAIHDPKTYQQYFSKKDQYDNDTFYEQAQYHSGRLLQYASTKKTFEQYILIRLLEKVLDSPSYTKNIMQLKKDLTEYRHTLAQNYQLLGSVVESILNHEWNSKPIENYTALHIKEINIGSAILIAMHKQSWQQIQSFQMILSQYKKTLAASLQPEEHYLCAFIRSAFSIFCPTKNLLEQVVEVLPFNLNMP